MTGLTATYGLSDSSDDSLFGVIEQDEWSAYAGAMTKLNMVKTLAEMFYGTDYGASVDCGFVDGKVETTVRVYPYEPERSYTPKLTYGELGECEVVDDVIEEKVRFSLETSASLKYPSQGIESVEWAGDCYNADLDAVDAPTLSIVDDDTVSASVAVYGTATVKYRVVCHKYEISISIRDEAEENKYSSVFYCVWGGGVEHLVLSDPPGADELEGECGLGDYISITPPDPSDPALQNPHADRHTKRDWCSRTLISDEVYAV